MFWKILSKTVTISSMISTLRHFLLYLLMMLLPLQVMASSIEYSCSMDMPACRIMGSTDHQKDCCHHHVHVSTNKHDSKIDKKVDGSSQSTSCGMGTTCTINAPLLALPNTEYSLPTLQARVFCHLLSTSYVSFFFDAPQRPPNVLA